MEETRIHQSPIRIKASAIVLAVCIALMIITAAVGHMIQTSWGTVSTQEITFTTDVGATVHAKLYVPEGATAETPAPAVILCHGYTASLDAIWKHFTINQMPLVSSTYWPMVHGNRPEEVLQDLEGLQVVRNGARNLAWLLRCIQAGREQGLLPPTAENAARTNFIR